MVYLHGRGSGPARALPPASPVSAHYGWLLCPIGPGDARDGRREWQHDRDYAARAAIASIDTLVNTYPRRSAPRQRDHRLHEGSYVGMNEALMNPRTFPRWLIIAADDRYIDSERERIQRGPRRASSGCICSRASRRHPAAQPARAPDARAAVRATPRAPPHRARDGAPAAVRRSAHSKHPGLAHALSSTAPRDGDAARDERGGESPCIVVGGAPPSG